MAEEIVLFGKFISEIGAPMAAVLCMGYAVWLVWKFINERMKANDLMMERFLTIHANSVSAQADTASAFNGLKLVINKFADELRLADETEKQRDEALHHAIDSITPAMAGRFDNVADTLNTIQEVVVGIQATIDTATKDTLPLITQSLDEIKETLKNAS